MGDIELAKRVSKLTQISMDISGRISFALSLSVFIYQILFPMKSLLCELISFEHLVKI